MKRILSLLIAVMLVLSLAACNNTGNATPTPGGTEAPTGTATPPPADTGYEIALITDVGNIDDKSFNEGSWTGVVNFATANNISYAYYKPSEDSNESRVEEVKAAIDKGAKVIVCPGYLFEPSVFALQSEYPEVQFLLIDGEPRNNNEVKIDLNTHCILFKEEQAGFFAGYAAVMDGYRNLGFLGGVDVPAVVRYGFGFVLGAEAAAADLGLAQDEVTIKYWYSDSFVPTDDIKIKMDSWYSDGTEVVFACGGGILFSCIAAAETMENAKIIGVDVDQASISELIITSAMKELAHSVEAALESLYANGGTWDDDHAGITAVVGVDTNDVGLPTGDSWRLENWTVAEYEALFAEVANGTIIISDATDVQPEVSLVKVDYQQ